MRWIFFLLLEPVSLSFGSYCKTKRLHKSKEFFKTLVIVTICDVHRFLLFDLNLKIFNIQRQSKNNQFKLSILLWIPTQQRSSAILQTLCRRSSLGTSSAQPLTTPVYTPFTQLVDEIDRIKIIHSLNRSQHCNITESSRTTYYYY